MKYLIVLFFCVCALENVQAQSLLVVCADPGSVYEGSADFSLDCSASGAPGANPVYTYAWTARGSTANMGLLSATDIPSPTFNVPDQVDSDQTYEYLLTVSAENADDAAAEVTVTVLNRSTGPGPGTGALSVVCADPGSVYEGSGGFSLDCSASGAPSGVAYAYSWAARGSTANTSRLSATDILRPTFYVPDQVDSDQTYEYLLTVSAENAESATAEVTVTVLNRSTGPGPGTGALSVVCADPGSVYEGSPDFFLDCSASGAPSGVAYRYVWAARGSTANTSLLSAADILRPTFYVPYQVDSDQTYEYLLTVSAENADDAAAEVTVTVLNRSTGPGPGTGALSVVCADPGSVYEGSPDFSLDCSASGAPSGVAYRYVWAARGSTANTSRLSATDILRPTFYVPDQVDSDQTYEYLLTVSAENADDAAADVTVTVLDFHKPGSIEEDRLALEALYDSTNGDNWIDNTNWKSDKPVQEWYGVSVDFDDGRIRALNLDGNGLSGNIPSGLGNMGGLQRLSLRENNLTGSIPSGMSNLKNLDSLNLADNYLTGTIPESFIDLSLTLFHIGGTNTLTVPSSLIPWYNSISNTDTEAPTASEPAELPATLTLGGNYPNPFNPATTIEYALPATDHVRLAVYDMAGRTVSVLVDGVRIQGQHAVRFNAYGLPAGTYVYRLQAAGTTRIRKMTLVK